MRGRIVVLTGGVGGAKLVRGLIEVVPAECVTAIVNTGDDFDHFGLRICPDIDTLLYTLSDKANRVQGWGRENESWGFMNALRSLGGEDWFALGDADLALHVLRTTRLARGDILSEIIDDFARSWGIRSKILPMSDDIVRTVIDTQEEGTLAFQRYFVERRCVPVARAVRFEGAAGAQLSQAVIEAVSDSSVEAILIAPSNPYLSIDPILSVPGMREALAASSAPVVAVSPIVDGDAIKGPTAKLMREFGIQPGPKAIEDHFAGFIDALLVDERDRNAPLSIRAGYVDTLMMDLADRARVAQAALDLAAQCSA